MDGFTMLLTVIIYIAIIYFAIKEGGKKNFIKDNKSANMLIGGLLGFFLGLLGLIILWLVPNDDHLN